MKILKGILYTILGIGVVYLILIPFAKSEDHVERSAVINADAKTVYDNVSNLKTWKKWSYWDMLDSAMRSTYEGAESGLGAVHKWTSNNPNVGEGSITVTKAEEPNWIEFELVFGGTGGNFGGWKIKDTTGGVLVTTYMDMKFPWYIRPMTLFMNMDEMMGEPFQTSLNNLKALSESAPKAEAAPLKIEEKAITAMPTLTVTDSCALADIGTTLGKLYGEVGVEMKKAGVDFAGAPFAIYHKVWVGDDNQMHFVMEAGIQVSKAVAKPGGRVKASEIKAGNVVIGYHYGAYEKTTDSHAALDEYLKANGKEVTGAPWEVYVTDPMAEKDTMKWLTEIYYPVK